MKQTMMQYAVSTLLIISMIVAAGCGEKSDQTDQQTTEKSSTETSDNPFDQMAKAAEQMTEAMGGDREPVPPVSFKTLEAFLPTRFGEMTTEGPEGESMTMGQWSYSQAKITFDGPLGESLRIEIFDYAHIGMLYTPFKMVWNMKMSKESSTGYERTTEIGKWPAFEKWEHDGQYMEISVLVGDRFIVSVHSRGVPEKDVRSILSNMDLAKLSTTTAS